MGWLDALQGKRVGLDTPPLIYFIERHHVYVDVVKPFFTLVDKGEISIVTSTTTLLEVLVQPFRRGDAYLAQQYRAILLYSPNFAVIELSSDIAEEAARLRALYGLRTPDAIQLATAIVSQASFFLTNDKRLASVKELKVLVLDDLKTQS
jgi:predicted nucleic acid-binding protein